MIMKPKSNVGGDFDHRDLFSQSACRLIGAIV